jgi:hypothetical protein
VNGGGLRPESKLAGVLRGNDGKNSVSTHARSALLRLRSTHSCGALSSQG